MLGLFPPSQTWGKHNLCWKLFFNSSHLIDMSKGEGAAWCFRGDTRKLLDMDEKHCGGGGAMRGEATVWESHSYKGGISSSSLHSTYCSTIASGREWRGAPCLFKHRLNGDFNNPVPWNVQAGTGQTIQASAKIQLERHCYGYKPKRHTKVLKGTNSQTEECSSLWGKPFWVLFVFVVVVFLA